MTTSNATSLLIHPYWVDFSSLYKRADAISHAYHSGNLVFFIGSGASKAYSASMPNWSELLLSLLSEVQTNNEDEREEIVQLIERQRYLLAAEAIKQYGIFDTNKKDLAVDSLVAQILKQRLGLSEHNPILHLSILDFAVPLFTTNYDTVIENIIVEYQVDGYKRTAITYEDEDDAAILLSPVRHVENYLFKLHGTVDRTQRLILDEEDYSEFYFHRRWPTSLQLLRHILATKMVIFIGFSLSDPDIMAILREATRYSSSYQHIALLHSSSVTPIEQEVLKKNYRVDPVLYEHHTLLPLYVMEMRNFYYRQNIALQIRSDRESLLSVFDQIKTSEKMQSDCSIVLFGSFAKYGNLSQPEADIDVLFLTDYTTQYKRIQSASAEQQLNRKVDITVMTRAELERLLRVGDPFATSVLVTGCPLEDPNDRYGILCRGFRSSYNFDDVLKNAIERYQMRWLRLWLYRDAQLQEYLQACHQWSVSIMQFWIIKNYYPLNSILGISLLGNARYTIREFATRFRGVDEEYFVSLMQVAKGIKPRTEIVRPSIKDLLQRYCKILQARYSNSDLEMLLPGNYIASAKVDDIVKLYKNLRFTLKALSRGEMGMIFGYGITNIEKSFLDEIAKVNKATEEKINTYDYPFFLLMNDIVENEEVEDLEDRQLMSICEIARAEWSHDSPIDF